MVHAMTVYCPTLMPMTCPHVYYSSTMLLPQDMHAVYMYLDIIVKIEKSRLSFFLFFFLIFIFFLIYFPFFYFQNLGLGLKPINIKRKVWKNNVVQCIQYMLTLRHIHSSLEQAKKTQHRLGALVYKVEQILYRVLYRVLLCNPYTRFLLLSSSKDLML